jgi:plastocyanin
MRPLAARIVLSLAIGAVVFTGCGGGSSSENVNGAAFTVHAKDTLKFDKTNYDAKAGDIKIGYASDGTMTHTLLVAGHDGFKLQVSGDKKTDEGTINLPPGEYTLYCDIAGHESAGMKATLTVS